MRKYVWRPLSEFCRTVSKRRGGRIRAYVHVLLVIYAIFWSVGPYSAQLYLYMLKVFPGFNGEKYSYYSIYHQLIGVAGLLVLLPVMSDVLRWHETTSSLAISLAITIGHLSTAFVRTLTGFYLSYCY